jgi:hypothetical protein
MSDANREFAAATGSHPVADQAWVASGCGSSGGWPVVYFKDTTSYMPCPTKGKHPGILLPCSHPISEDLREDFAVFNGEPA